MDLDMYLFQMVKFFKNHPNKLILWTGIVTILSTLLVAMYEFKLIPSEQLFYYIISKLLIVLAINCICVLLIIDSENLKYQNIYSILSYGYVIQGDFYRPNYFIAFFQFFITQSLCFSQKKSTYLKIHFIGAILCCLSFYYNFERNVEIFYKQNSFADFISIIIITFGVGITLFFQVNRARKEKDIINSKFILIGNQASNIIHDVKNLINAPSIYLDLIRQTEKYKNDKEMNFMISNLQNNIYNISDSIKRLYEIINSNTRHSDLENARVCLDHVLSLLSHRFKNVKIEIFETSKNPLLLNQEALELILLNIFYNSLDAFSRTNKTDPKIHVIIGSDKISVVDNAGGLEKEQIDFFNSNQISTKPGLGIYLMKTSALHSRIKLEFKNTKLGSSKGTKVSVYSI